MTNEERDIISQFVARVAGAAQPTGGSLGGSVPATTQPALPPVDRDADRLIADQFQRYPEARYRITQLAFVQEHALVEAQNRIQRLEWELQQAQQAAERAQQAQQSGRSGGLFGNLFGGGRTQPNASGGPWNQSGGAYGQPQYAQSAPPPPQYPPNYQPGVFQQRGSGFLGSALTTAAGVAGGMVAGNALMNLFSGSHGMGGGAFGGGFTGGAPGGAGPWSQGDPGYVDQGTWATDAGGATPIGNQDYVDQGTWDQPSAPDTSWSDNSGSSDSGGWDSGGGGSSDDTF